MDDGELDSPNQEAFSDSNLEEFINEMLMDVHACSHTHTCNPPGPDSSHTHTCVHVHTKIVPAESDDTSESTGKKPKKRAIGNREAVRKYREKKKAKTASLEEEVVKLKALNQQLVKRLQGQAGLESEVARLKCLLVDIRGRIEGEIGSFPYHKRSNMNLGSSNVVMGGGLDDSHVINPCHVQCGDQVYCLNDGRNGNAVAINGQQGYIACEFESLPCVANLGTANVPNSVLKELPDYGVGDRVPNGCSPGGNKRRGGNRSVMAG